MLVLGIVAFLAGVLLVAGEAHERRGKRLAEQASLQRESEGLATRLAAVEAHFPQPLVMMDARGLIRRVNPAAENLFGYTEDELFGHNILRLLPVAPSARNPGAPKRSASDGGAAGLGETEVRCKDGSTVKVRMSGTRSVSEGQSDFYMFFETPTPADAQPPLAMVERVVGRITGKFEELLTTINGYGELALHSAPADGQLRQHLEEIISASEQASFLTRNLLAFSGTQLIPTEPVDLNAVAQDATREIPYAVDLDLQAEAPVALANRECIRQVIQLLTESAGLRMGGLAKTIRVHTSERSLDRSRTVYSGDVPAGRYAVIAVSDSGAALEREVLAHMFEPMYMSPAMAGVDLSPVYGLISSLGGRLHVESGEEGTRFEIWLPHAEEQSSTADTQSRGAVANG